MPKTHYPASNGSMRTACGRRLGNGCVWLAPELELATCTRCRTTRAHGYQANSIAASKSGEGNMRKTVVKTSIDPAAAEKCYACDDRATGLRDRRPEGGQLERACARHADPSLVAQAVCQLCLGPARKGSLLVDGHYVHRTCHTEASES